MKQDKTSYIGIDANRLAHTESVGRQAYQLARDLLGWPEQKCQEMYVLGFLHDIGYQFAANQLDHERVGGELLHSSGYRYWKEVYYHGKPESEYQSQELFLLNFADMVTSRNGERVTFSERLKDIGNRYGVESYQYHNASKLISEIKKQAPKYMSEQ